MRYRQLTGREGPEWSYDFDGPETTRLELIFNYETNTWTGKAWFTVFWCEDEGSVDLSPETVEKLRRMIPSVDIPTFLPPES